jgi:hypothetical protein
VSKRDIHDTLNDEEQLDEEQLDEGNPMEGSRPVTVVSPKVRSNHGHSKDYLYSNPTRLPTRPDKDGDITEIQR